MYCRTSLSHLRKTALTLSACLITVTAVPALAETSTSASSSRYYVAGDGNQRINLSGRLRMLSQRIPSMACNSAAGIEQASSQENLAAAVAEFTLILNGLSDGDPNLEIYGREGSQRVLQGIAQLEARWDPFAEAAQSVLTGRVTDPAVQELASTSLPLLKDAQMLVGRVVEQHYDRVHTIASEAFTIDFAGRQRMLAQQMSKNVCLLHTNGDTAAARAELEKGFALFDATLNALKVGMAEVGITPPPNETVVEGLAVVDAAWQDVVPRLQAAMAGARFDQEERAALLNDLNALTAKMNAAVKMYVAASALSEA